LATANNAADFGVAASAGVHPRDQGGGAARGGGAVRAPRQRSAGDGRGRAAREATSTRGARPASW